MLLAAAFMTSGCSIAEPVTEDADLNSLEERYWQNVDEERMNFTEADVSFMMDMIMHHTQALILTDLAMKNDASLAIKRMSERIENSQLDEIATMQQWLRDRDQPVAEIEIDGLNLIVHIQGDDDHGAGMNHTEGHAEGHTDHSDMPGMLSPDQLEQLEAARSREFDALFLEYMIIHHEGAVIMVHNLFETDGAAQDRESFRLASDIQVDQRTEINRMEEMLRNMDRP